MKAIRTLATVVAVFGLSASAQAGLLDQLFGHRGKVACDPCDAAKCCECAPVTQPCKPTIVRPTHRNVYTYQRQISTLKPPCCDLGGRGKQRGCRPVGRHGRGMDCCVDACAPAAAGQACAVPAACAPVCPAPAAAGPVCAAPCAPAAAAPVCAAPCAPAASAPVCAAPYGPAAADQCCPAGVGCDACGVRNPREACQVATLIYESQTACHPRDRAKAISRLGKYDVLCYPEIMCAWKYALNDADPGVRKAAAGEIAHAVRKNACLCSQCVVDALTCALADCDRGVRKAAEKALGNCGYQIVDACEVACAPCAPGYAPGVMPMPMNGEGAAPAPAPPEEPKAYFPRKQSDGSTSITSKLSLSRLFSMAR